MHDVKFSEIFFVKLYIGRGIIFGGLALIFIPVCLRLAFICWVGQRIVLSCNQPK